MNDIPVKKIYKPREGFHLTKEQAERYGEELDRLMDENGGKINPKEIVAAAKNPRSPLHDYFQWNKDKAAERYWIYQAKKLVTSIEVEIKIVGKQTTTRIALSIREKPSGPKSYLPIERVLSNKEYREQAIRDALKQLVFWERQYNQFRTEFREIFDAIQKYKAKYNIK